jgi:glycyl-tRNA synthetase beta chain
MRARLTEPAEIALLAEMEARWPAIENALAADRYSEAMRELSALSKPVDRFFVDVLVMAEDAGLREARLTLLTALRRTILNIADIAEIVES